MTWFLKVTEKESLTFGIEENGAESLWGSATGEIFLAWDAQDELPEKLRNAAISWSIRTPESADRHIDGNNDGLFQRVRSDPQTVHGIIQFYEANAEFNLCESVTFRMIVPSIRFAAVRRLFEMSMLSRAPVEYLLSIPFNSFRRVGVPENGVPTVSEFIQNGKPIFFREFTLTAKRVLDYIEPASE
jgi:hypothetical protein